MPCHQEHRSPRHRVAPASHRAHQEGQVFADERTTVEQFVRAWLKTVAPSLRPTPGPGASSSSRKHALPYVGKLRLTKLDARHLKELYADRVRSGLSTTTVLQLPPHPPACSARRDALEPRQQERLRAGHAAAQGSARLRDALPRAGAALPRRRQGRPAGSLVGPGAHHQHAGRGLFGLRWADVNFDAGAHHLVKHLWTRSVAGSAQPGTIKISSSRHGWGDRSTRNFLRRSFYPLLDRTGLLRIRFHDPRHSAATLLLGLGVHPEIVSELLGHSQIGITLDLYSPRDGYYAAGGRARLPGPARQSTWQSPRRARASAPPRAPVAQTESALLTLPACPRLIHCCPDQLVNDP
jgi:integrase